MLPKTTIPFLIACLALSTSIAKVNKSAKDDKQIVKLIKEIAPDGKELTVFNDASEGNSDSGGGSSLRTGGVVGSLPGTGTVLPDGSASYTIPIFCSPGTNGMQPELAITYNSNGGDGVMGLGWGLNGLSSISRGRKDAMHFGNNVDGVDLDADDRFYLNG